MNFWQTIQKHTKPFFCVAPMADVTDAAFRRLISTYSRHGQDGGGPDVMWTEFVSANGLVSPGRAVLARDLEYSDIERPIVAQLFSSDPDKMRQAAKYVAELGFDGIDINMGCPDRTIEKQGAGAAMIKDKEIAKKIIQAVKDGVKDAGKEIPVSVKTRVGYYENEINSWVRFILEQDIAALTIHARTRKDLSKVPATWKYVQEVVALRNAIAPQTIIIGNGDVVSVADGVRKARESGCDGIMVGRALFGNPWFFDSKREIVATIPKKVSTFLRNLPVIGKYFETRRSLPQSRIQPITIQERLHVLVEHTELFEQLLGDIKSFSIMKKHYKAYCTGFAGSKELRMALMEAKNSAEVKTIISAFLVQYSHA